MLTEDPLRFIPPEFIDHHGLGGVICITRGTEGSEDFKWRGTLAEWLKSPCNFGGDWYVDEGQGWPPGRFKIHWDDEQHAWQWHGADTWQRGGQYIEKSDPDPRIVARYPLKVGSDK